MVGDKRLGILEAVGEVFPEAKYQHCIVHVYHNVFSVTFRVAKMLKAILAHKNKEIAGKKSKPWERGCSQ